MKPLQQRIEEALPDMRKQKKEWTVCDILKQLNLSEHNTTRRRVISKLEMLQEKSNIFELKKTHWHGTGYELVFLK